ncbi:DUF3078 domain-containing protein [Cytophagales bacterium LB-30]|uniref:DUF3078 domain-containing protein n=1 Tax=Shiella aurantiaca TaxID=3058365 RepID=A0ABT8F673_9BACT|nr:DUF3078 domain-containing protein [Shiella aurantiaca]MDN4165961.1 DUF3078 domain-containing protein [Shiella aurantiaca]
MLKKLVLITFLISSFTSYAQVTTNTQDSIWTRGGSFNINFSQVNLSNWAGGGQSSIALSGLFSVFANRETKYSLWENRLETALGGIRQEDIGEFRKTDDYFILVSKYGRKINESFLFSGLMDFRTQLAKGFVYSNDPLTNEVIATEVSEFMAPGYLLLSLGATYKKGDVFTATVSPLTGKSTFVLDDSLSAQGAYGVAVGEKFRFQGGANLSLSFKKTLMENVTFSTNANFFADYQNFMDEVDVNWDALLLFKINKFLSSSISAQAIYDDDINVTREDGTLGPALQFKTAIQVGLTLSF